MNLVNLHQKFMKYPLGEWFFSYLVARRAPYFKSISPRISQLSLTQCTVQLKKRKSVLNHLGTIHAIAMCNACELAFGLVMEAGGLAKNLRWIPKGMRVRYLKKAESDLAVTTEVPKISEFKVGDHIVQVVVKDALNQVVMEAEITVYVSEKPQK